jgi:hypothetical protein
MRHKIWLASLAVIVIVFSIIFLFRGYGLFSSYNYFTARRDIKSNNIQIISAGLPMICSKDSEIKAVRVKYGFKVNNIGCVVSTQEMNGIEEYNNVVEQYLSQRNGKDWRMAYETEVDSLYRVAFGLPEKLTEKAMPGTK